MTSDDIQIYVPGERVLKKGDPADKAYMILSGKVRVYLRNNDKVVDLATLEKGDIFGETAIFETGEYGANVDALEETSLQIITPQSLKKMMGECDPVLDALVRMLMNRLNDTNKKLLESETREFIDVAFI